MRVSDVCCASCMTACCAPEAERAVLPSTSCTSSGDMSTMQAMASALTPCTSQQDVGQHLRYAMPVSTHAAEEVPEAAGTECSVPHRQQPAREPSLASAERLYPSTQARGPHRFRLLPLAMAPCSLHGLRGCLHGSRTAQRQADQAPQGLQKCLSLALQTCLLVPGLGHSLAQLLPAGISGSLGCGCLLPRLHSKWVAAVSLQRLRSRRVAVSLPCLQSQSVAVVSRWEQAVDSQAGMLEVPQASRAGHGSTVCSLCQQGPTVCSTGPCRDCLAHPLHATATWARRQQRTHDRRHRLPSNALHDVVGWPKKQRTPHLLSLALRSSQLHIAACHIRLRLAKLGLYGIPVLLLIPLCCRPAATQTNMCSPMATMHISAAGGNHDRNPLQPAASEVCHVDCRG